MRASKGGLTHDIIMRLTWRQFLTYMDTFTWSTREEHEEGRRKNKADDLYTMLQVPELKERKQKMLDDVHERLRKIKEREEERRRTGQQPKGVPRVIGQ